MSLYKLVSNLGFAYILKLNIEGYIKVTNITNAAIEVYKLLVLMLSISK